MTIAASESATEEFDLDIRIDDFDQARTDLIPRAMSYGTSCSMCCPIGTAVTENCWTTRCDSEQKQCN
jgi:hypothetical protein